MSNAGKWAATRMCSTNETAGGVLLQPMEQRKCAMDKCCSKHCGPVFGAAKFLIGKPKLFFSTTAGEVSLDGLDSNQGQANSANTRNSQPEQCGQTGSNAHVQHQ
uniref:Uncharacterized protein n=1 Tax=Globodera rostochiensis TaxID=31243 RepID=A0A914HKF7_GLORO